MGGHASTPRRTNQATLAREIHPTNKQMCLHVICFSFVDSNIFKTHKEKHTWHRKHTSTPRRTNQATRADEIHSGLRGGSVNVNQRLDVGRTHLTHSRSRTWRPHCRNNQPTARKWVRTRQHHRLAITYVRAQAKRANNSTDEALIVKVMTVSSWLLSLLRFPAACP